MVWKMPAMTSAGTGQEAVRDTVLVMVAPAAALDAGEWGVVALVVLASVSVVALLMFLWRLEGHVRRLTGIANQMEDRSRPVLERATGIADNLEGITRSLRAETEHLSGSVRALSDRLRQASAHMETRIDDFNALLEVVQAEAEETFLKAASAVRGVSASARALDGVRKTGRGAPAKEARASVGRADGDPAPSLDEHPPDDGDPPADDG